MDPVGSHHGTHPGRIPSIQPIHINHTTRNATDMCPQSKTINQGLESDPGGDRFSVAPLRREAVGGTMPPYNCPFTVVIKDNISRHKIMSFNSSYCMSKRAIGSDKLRKIIGVYVISTGMVNKSKSRLWCQFLCKDRTAVARTFLIQKVHSQKNMMQQ